MAGETTQTDEIEEVFRDPIRFSSIVLGFQPYEYQKELLDICKNNKRVSACWCRQSGKSVTIAAYCVWRAITYPDQDILIVSPTQRQSHEVFIKIKTFIERAPGDYLFGLCEGIKYTATEIQFNTGSRILSLPTGVEGTNIRGYKADVVVIEESGHVRDSIVSSVLMPMISSTNGQIIQIGTPRGTNHFFEACYGEKSPYIFSHVDWRESVRVKQMSQEFIDEQKNSGMISHLEFETEYEAKFIPDEDRYFPDEIISQCTYDMEEEKETDMSHHYYLGVDIASEGADSTVLTVVKHNAQTTDMIQVVKIVTTNKTLTTETIGRVKLLHERFKFKRIYVDQTGLGKGVMDALGESLGYIVRGITFSLKSKQDLFSNLKIILEKSKIQMPELRPLQYQLRDLRYKLTSTGEMKIHHSERGHDDYCDSLALAVQFYDIRNKKPSFGIVGV